MPSLSLTTLRKRQKAINAEIAAREEKDRVEKQRRLTEPAAAAILGRIIMDSEPSGEPVAVRLQEALDKAKARRSDVQAWELLAETYKLDLPAALTDPIPRPSKRDTTGTTGMDPTEHDPASSDEGKAGEAQGVLEAVNDAA